MSDGKYVPRPGHIPGVAVNFGGLDFVLAPLGLRLTREFEAKAIALNKPDVTPEDSHAFNLEVILASLHRNYPDITVEELDGLLDTAAESESVVAVMNQSGLKRVKPGELKPG